MRSPLNRARRGFVMACVGAASLAMGCAEPNETPNGEDVALSDEEQASFAPPETLRIGEPGQASASFGFMDVDPAAQTRSEVAFDEDDAWMAKGLVRTALPRAKIYNWVAGQGGDTVMDPVSTHVCFLTRVSGNLGGQSAVFLHRNLQGYNPVVGISNDDSTHWQLAGFQGQFNSLIGEATCVPRADFKVSPGGFTQISTRGRLLLPGCSQTASINMWSGPSITYIAGVRGKFAGGGESVDIIHSSNETVPSKLKVSTQTCPDTEATAYSFFAGLPKHANHPTYLHDEPPYLAYFSNSSTQMGLSAKSNTTKRERLVRTKDAVCYLTRVSGEFNGGGERLRIYPEKDASGTEWWWFEAKAEGGRAYGNARCILYDQRIVEVKLY